MTLKEKIIKVLERSQGLTDRELTNAILGPKRGQQPVNQAARGLEAQEILERRKRADGLIGNYLAPGYRRKLEALKSRRTPAARSSDGLSEDEVKERLKTWLEREGWNVQVAWGWRHGVDVEATRDNRRWLIEVKGCGSRPEMRVNYFIGVLGELLQRMDDPQAEYAIALPDMPQFRRLWDRLPKLAKARTGITALFVSKDGHIAETE